MPPVAGDRSYQGQGGHGGSHLGPDVDAEALEERGQGPELAGVVVVAGNDDGGDALGEEARQEVVHELLGLRRPASFVRKMDFGQRRLDAAHSHAVLVEELQAIADQHLEPVA